MPNINISKIKTRRGTNDQRKSVIFDQGEIVSTTDTKRLYLGTGSLSGGVSIGSKFHNPILNLFSLSSTISEVGDLVYCNNTIYQLTANDYSDLNNWINIGPKINTSYFNFDDDNIINLSPSSIPINFLIPNNITNGLKIESNLLQLDIDSTFYDLIDNKLTLKNESISSLQISPSNFYRGITGGGFEKIGLNVDSDYFYFVDNTLSLYAVPKPEVIFSDLSSSWFGDGLIYDFGGEQIRTNLTDVDNITLSKSLSGGISLNPSLIGQGLVLNGSTLSSNLVNVADSTLMKDLTGGIKINPSLFGNGLSFDVITNTLSTTLTNVDNVTLSSDSLGIIFLPTVGLGLSANHSWSQIETDSHGRVIENKSSIIDLLTGDSTLSSYNAQNSLSSIFNGDALGLSGIQITQFTALSSDGVTVVNLSSAGFITFENTVTRLGLETGRFAIPIYRY